MLVCEAGVTLENANAHAEEHGFVVPLDLAPKAECQIGGNVASNAGGLRYVRFGSLRGSIVGLEVRCVLHCHAIYRACAHVDTCTVQSSDGALSVEAGLISCCEGCRLCWLMAPSWTV